jgi:hypothetical protein
MSLQVLPLAITMMVGPQIMSAIIFVTTVRAIRTSVTWLLGVLIGTTVGVVITRTLAALFGAGVSLNDSSNSSLGSIIQYALVGLLVVAAVRSYATRATAEPPRWLTTLMTAEPLKAFLTGVLLILLFPSDVLILLTVGINLEQNDVGISGALPFIGATVLIAALPFLTYVLLRKRAKAIMPRIRDWMNSHSWLINIIAYVFFIVLILF